MSKPSRYVQVGLAAVLALSLAAPPAAAQSDEPLVDPLPDPITSTLGLTVEEFLTFPESEPVPPPTDERLIRHARINYLGEVPDGSGRLYVPDLNGMLYLVEDGVPHGYLDVGATFAPDFFSGQGLGSGFGFVAFHPDFAENGKLYTVHTEWGEALEKPTDLPAQPNTGYHGVLTEWTATDPAANTFSGTRREMLRLGFATRIHGIQQVDFNPTARRWHPDYGLLYLGVGDGGIGVSGDDPQDLGMPHGKVLRIDPLGDDSGNGEYGIPRANPFVRRPGAVGEIYAYGLRNPHRFSWDARPPHRMYLGNIGQHRVESIYEVRRGDNFGWSEREGPFVFRNDDPDCNVYPLPRDDRRYHYTYPVAAYDHNVPPDAPCSDVGVAVIGGFVYRGSAVPELHGKYVFGDDVDGRLFYTNAHEMRRHRRDMAPTYQFMLYDESGQRVTMQDLAGDERVDLRFGQDGDGEFYILSKANGTVWMVTGTRHFASCDVGDTTVTDVMGAEHWAPVTPEKWEFPGDEVILAEPGTDPGPPRRPFEYAVLTAGPAFGPVQIDGEVRIDTPVEISNRDVIIVFGYRSATEFYYAHLSTDNTIYPHNGIFVVNNADRLRIDDQWDEPRSRGAPPAITDEDWHEVRVVHCADSGEIAVYVDGAENPLITTADTTLDSGRVGFGSFDNIGRLRDLTVTGTAVDG
ncbi:MAG: PQQ-dependent sugar dehydrogenase [Acidimicrobiales bacterium]